MPTMMVFRQTQGPERVWVSQSEVDWWKRLCNRQGWPTATVTEYREWGGFFPPHPESVGDVMFYPATRGRRFSTSR